MRWLGNQNLRYSAKVKSVKDSWNLFKDTIIEAKLKCVPQIKKYSRRTKKVPLWLKQVNEAVGDKKALFLKNGS